MGYEETHFEHVHDHRGLSGGAVAALVILAAAVVGLAVFLVMRANNNANQQPVSQTTNIEQPTPQPPAPGQQPGVAPSTPQDRTVVVKRADDDAIQAEVGRRIANAPDLSSLGITARVSDGRVILTGRVNSNNLRLEAERIVRSITGVKALDNQIVVVTRQP